MSINRTEAKDRRHMPRWQASYFFKPGREYTRPYFDVIDRKTGSSIGHLVDMTFDGMKIKSPHEIGKGRPLSLLIQLPEEVKDCGEIQVAARSLWCERNDSSGEYYVGLEILSIAPPYGEIVDALVQP
ncbi:MAG: PilZ domain-containing protein [candidate division Zixibacteria bacterium]|jgi:hypothetical protein|nr:PilZ domain-containing protein [candidate division Zixibacteria bacterium]